MGQTGLGREARVPHYVTKNGGKNGLGFIEFYHKRTKARDQFWSEVI